MSVFSFWRLEKYYLYMNKVFFRILITSIFLYLYIFLFLYFSIKVESFRLFFLKFISRIKNREIGEAFFIIIFLLIPISLIIYISRKTKKY